MNKSVVYRPIVKMIDGKLSEKETKMEILEEVIRVHKSDLVKLKKMKGLIWIKNDPSQPIQTIKEILKMTI